jgi:hypothetical protein
LQKRKNKECFVGLPFCMIIGAVAKPNMGFFFRGTDAVS